MTNWPRAFRFLAENYGYSPQQIYDLTFDQVVVLCSLDEDLQTKRTQKFSIEELRAMGILPSLEEVQRQEKKQRRKEKKQRRAERMKKLEQARQHGV